MRGYKRPATLRCTVMPGGNHSKAQALNLPVSAGNTYYLQANPRGAKVLHSKERLGHPREAVSQTLVNHLIYTRQ